ncbi:MAG: UDP-N-acetylmuramate--L-alanine ligase [Candidatus Sumerlaeales bacterium]|nr:UDP-N-acetylmuramate--L-alanine ligase [Candidatus Sumerlaeales bacterium]
MAAQKEVIHFIGIGGIGMSGIARLYLKDTNYVVTGSDANDSEIVTALREFGAKVHIGHNTENVHGATMIVKSSAIRDTNPEIMEANRLSIPILHRSTALAILFNKSFGISVAGTHGKTTTSSMMSEMLTNTNSSPSFVVGGIIRNLGTNASVGDSDLFVIEADESDGSLVSYNPNIAIITNIDLDHMDHYANINALHSVFLRHIGNIKKGGCLIWCKDCKQLNVVMDKVVRKDMKIVSYGINKGDIQAKNIVYNGVICGFDVVRYGEKIGHFELSIPGRHNVLNTLAVIEAGLQLNKGIDDIKASLEHCLGSKRRFQVLYADENNQPLLVDDYAHHPTEIRATLAAARSVARNRKIIVAFQPHRYSRTVALASEFGKAFDVADEIIVCPIYAAGETPIDGVDHNMILCKIENANIGRHKDIYSVKDLCELENIIAKKISSNALVMTLGAGNINQISNKIAAEMKL